MTSDSSFEVHSMHGLAWLVEARPGTGVAVLGRDFTTALALCALSLDNHMLLTLLSIGVLARSIILA